MDGHFDKPYAGREAAAPVTLAAVFADDDGAMDAAASINASLEEAAIETDDLFAAGGGVAASAEVDRIYSRFGLRNTSGWRQETPLTAAGREVLWRLPAGAPIEDAEQLLAAHGAAAVRIAPQSDGDWTAAPHPLAIPFVDQESGEVFYDVVDVGETPPRRGPATARKRTLH